MIGVFLCIALIKNKMIKYKIILCLLVVIIFAVPIIINPIFINNYPKPDWYHYILILIIFPVLTWLSINFGIKKLNKK